MDIKPTHHLWFKDREEFVWELSSHNRGYYRATWATEGWVEDKNYDWLEFAKNDERYVLKAIKERPKENE